MTESKVPNVMADVNKFNMPEQQTPNLLNTEKSYIEESAEKDGEYQEEENLTEYNLDHTHGLARALHDGELSFGVASMAKRAAYAEVRKKDEYDFFEDEMPLTEDGRDFEAAVAAANVEGFWEDVREYRDQIESYIFNELNDRYDGSVGDDELEEVFGDASEEFYLSDVDDSDYAVTNFYSDLADNPLRHEEL